MLIILSKPLFFTILFSGYLFSAHAEETCYSGKIKLTRFGKLELFNAQFCTNQPKTTLVSKSCFRKKCDAYKHSVIIKEDSLYSEVGKPGAKLCRKLGGEPQMIEFSVEKKWYKLDRCLFSTDESFVDTGTLFKSYFDEYSKIK